MQPRSVGPCLSRPPRLHHVHQPMMPVWMWCRQRERERERGVLYRSGGAHVLDAMRSWGEIDDRHGQVTSSAAHTSTDEQTDRHIGAQLMTTFD
mmetsp:Transcript_42843/g.121389  ORF Transcript_42843/g.121389 Transcript_42843/m.121389 type:complete len:94 (+) Transcript_42843:1207-1488(+)